MRRWLGKREREQQQQQLTYWNNGECFITLNIVGSRKKGKFGSESKIYRENCVSVCSVLNQVEVSSNTHTHTTEQDQQRQ